VLAWATPVVPAAAPLLCQASISNHYARDYTTIDVRVHTVSYAAVTTVAYYKTVNRKHNKIRRKKVPPWRLSRGSGRGVSSVIRAVSVGRVGSARRSRTAAIT
jgi:hypothetical protein